MSITYICRPKPSYVESMHTFLPSRLKRGCKSTRYSPVKCATSSAVDFNLASGTNSFTGPVIFEKEITSHGRTAAGRRVPAKIDDLIVILPRMVTRVVIQIPDIGTLGR